MKRFTLTGGIACGKSTVSEALKKRGWQVIDTDEIAQEIVKKDSEGYKKVIDSFGSSILNSEGSIDRLQLGDIIFTDSGKRSLLNSILHPLIQKEWQLQHSVCVQRGATLVVIPLLYEVEGDGWFDSVACVGCSHDTQQMRLKQRGFDFGQIQMRIKAQMGLEQKLKKSDLVVWNNGSEELLEQQVNLLDRHWKSL